MIMSGVSGLILILTQINCVQTFYFPQDLFSGFCSENKEKEAEVGGWQGKFFLKKRTQVLTWALFCLQGNLKNESNQQHKVNKVTQIVENWIWLLFVWSSIWFIFLRASFSSCTPWRGMWTVPPWETCYKPWPLNSQRMNNQDWYFNSGKQTALNIKYTWI